MQFAHSAKSLKSFEIVCIGFGQSEAGCWGRKIGNSQSFAVTALFPSISYDKRSYHKSRPYKRNLGNVTVYRNGAKLVQFSRRFTGSCYGKAGYR